MCTRISRRHILMNILPPPPRNGLSMVKVKRKYCRCTLFFPTTGWKIIFLIGWAKAQWTFTVKGSPDIGHIEHGREDVELISQQTPGTRLPYQPNWCMQNTYGELRKGKKYVIRIVLIWVWNTLVCVMFRKKKKKKKSYQVHIDS